MLLSVVTVRWLHVSSDASACMWAWQLCHALVVALHRLLRQARTSTYVKRYLLPLSGKGGNDNEILAALVASARTVAAVMESCPVTLRLHIQLLRRT
jgi:hypothetical protein